MNYNVNSPPWAGILIGPAWMVWKDNVPRLSFYTVSAKWIAGTKDWELLFGYGDIPDSTDQYFHPGTHSIQGGISHPWGLYVAYGLSVGENYIDGSAWHVAGNNDHGEDRLWLYLPTPGVSVGIHWDAGDEAV